MVSVSSLGLDLKVACLARGVLCGSSRGTLQAAPAPTLGWSGCKTMQGFRSAAIAAIIIR